MKRSRLISRGPDQAQELIASATNLILSGGGMVFRITGTTTINTIAAPSRGSPVVYLIFAASVTVQDTSTASGNLALAGSADFSATGQDVLHLVWNIETSLWHEVSRSAN